MPPNVFVDRREVVAVVAVRIREADAQSVLVRVPRHRHFEPVEPTLRAFAERSDAFDHAMTVGVCLEADREVGRIGVFHDVPVPLAPLHGDSEDSRGP